MTNPFISNQELFLGTVQFGMLYGVKNKSQAESQGISKIEAHRILDYAITHGIQSFDTARDYGTAEEVLGHWANKKMGHFFTKIKDTQNLSHAVKLFEQSLQALGLDQVQCLSLHLFEECLKEHNIDLLKTLKKEGRILSTGISVYTTEQIEYVVKNTDIEVIQSPYNLLDHDLYRKNVFELAKNEGRTIHVRSIFLQGLLLMDHSTIPANLAAVKPALTDLQNIAHHSGLNMQELCLLYAMGNPLIDAIIIGVDSLDNLKSNIDIFKNGHPNKIDRHKIENIFLSDPRLLNPSLWSQL